MDYEEPRFIRLTQFTDFGLRMSMRMASEPKPGFSTAEFADEFHLSRNHLAKIMQRLAQTGLVETRRGSSGGAILARPAEDIRLGAIVRLWKKVSPLTSASSRAARIVPSTAVAA